MRITTTRAGIDPLNARGATTRYFLALAAVILLAMLAVRAEQKTNDPVAADFTLLDQDGHPFRLAAQRGHPVVVFFGYTHCADACPTTLARLTRAVRMPQAPPDVRVVFITVDPDRDSPDVLKRYISPFDPHFAGLTGNGDALAAVYTAYNVWHRRESAQYPGGDYEVTHSTTVYYVGRDGVIRGYGSWDDAVPDIAHKLAAYQ